MLCTAMECMEIKVAQNTEDGRAAGVRTVRVRVGGAAKLATLVRGNARSIAVTVLALSAIARSRQRNRQKG